jgi:hypothetical protein
MSPSPPPWGLHAPANRTEAGITLTWGGGAATKLVVDMARATHKIIHIGTKGLGGK